MLKSKAYLEDYHYIKLIVHESEMHLVDCDNLFVSNKRDNIKLHVYKIEQFGEYYHINTTFKGRVLLHRDYFINLKENKQIQLFLGQIMRTTRFDVENYYDGPLGVEYHKEYTIFRVWTPVSKEVKLVLNNAEYDLEYVSKGLWELKLDGDHENSSYYYKVRINDEFKKSLDPYAVSSNINSEANYVVDMNKAYQIKHHNNFNGNYLESIIYELHLKDVNVENDASDYLSLIKKLDYIKSLGITHIQIMPVNVFGGVDEANKAAMYNWGYNPVEFNSLSEWYSSDGAPYTAINEFKQLVDEIHHKGLNINLDVVYNHVYVAKTFSLNILVPGYVYRTDEHGFMTNGSGCGTDIASERKMNRRFIVDSLVHFVKNYDVDGFRFDLMGLLDYETLNIVYKTLKQIKPNIMLYGEGWNLSTGLIETKRATINNNWALPNYAFFNDVFRNTMRGEPYNNVGFIYDYNRNYPLVKETIKGSSSKSYLFQTPSQSINYVECHDNCTFYDKLSKDVYNLGEEDKVKYVILSLGLVILSIGIPFIHAGEEAMRSKKGIDNTYNASLDINGIDLLSNPYHNIVEALKYFINFRKEQSIYKINDSDTIDDLIEFDVLNDSTLRMKTKMFDIIFKNNKQELVLNYENLEIIYNGIVYNQNSFNDIGVYIIRK